MIDVGVTISNPFSDRWDSGHYWFGKISKNKAWEVQAMKSNTIVKCAVSLSFRRDHAGLRLEVGLLGYEVCVQVHDVRHWDHRTQSWETYK